MTGPSALPTDSTDDTLTQRQERLERRLRLVRLIALSLAAFVLVLAAGDSAAGVYDVLPPWMRAVVFSVVVSAGALLAAAYTGFEDAYTTVTRRIAADSTGGERPVNLPWPERAESLYKGSLLVMSLSPLAFLAVTWCAAIPPCRCIG